MVLIELPTLQSREVDECLLAHNPQVPPKSQLPQ
jgi:hypothetical protein